MIFTSSKDLSPVVRSLNRQQANAMVAYQNYKKYHWLTYGPLFRDLHLLFDGHAQQILAHVDEYAERALMIGGRPLADPREYLAGSTITASSGSMDVAAMVREALQNHDRMIDELHEDTHAAAEAGDIGTADLYTRLVQEQQKQRWFLSELLRKADGLVT